MTETDISTVLIDGDIATIMGVKYQRIIEPKSPAEEAYKEVYGWYPPTTSSVSNFEDTRWSAFQNGYNASQKPEKEQKWDVVRESVKWCEEHRDESVEDYLKPHTPEKTEQLLREAFQKVQQTEEWKETQRKIDSKNPPKFLKFELGQSLTDLIYDWWEDVFTKNSNDDIENCIGRLVYWIEEWLPKEQSAAGSQNVDVEFLVDGFNDCLKKIKSKLRNKK
jgi:hypothetical protein